MSTPGGLPIMFLHSMFGNPELAAAWVEVLSREG